MTQSALPIGKLSGLTGVKIPTIRFYEQIGLLPPPERTSTDRRVYGGETVRRLSFIKRARQLGFSVEAVQALLALSDEPDQRCDEANQLAASQLAEVESKILQLEALRTELRRLAGSGCSGPAGQCQVIEALAGSSD